MKKHYKDLLVWQKAIELAPNIYKLIHKLPEEETFALGMQLRRAVVSVASNVAEGQARKHVKEFLQHLRIAKGSLAELETQIIIAEKLSYFTKKEVEQAEIEINEVSKILNALLNSLSKTDNTLQ
ncbi:MAG: four helix bundle protein [Chthoniobacterales bacterium]